MILHLRTFTFLLLFFLGTAIFAAPAPPPNGGGATTPPCWPPPCVPIDGGISLLIAAGAAYGARKLYQSQKEKNL